MSIKTDAQLKAYADANIDTNGTNSIAGSIHNTMLNDTFDSKVSIIDAQTVNGVKTFGAFPVTPSSDPSTDYQAANKQYVDKQKVGEPRIRFAQTATTTVSNTTSSITTISTGVGSATFAANLFAVGDVVRITQSGLITNATGSDEPITIKTQLGSTTLGSGTGLAPLGASDWEYRLTGQFTVRTIGATGTIMWTGTAEIEGRSNISMTVVPMSATSATTIDTTANLTFDIQAQWGSASLNYQLTSLNTIIELLKPIETPP